MSTVPPSYLFTCEVRSGRRLLRSASKATRLCCSCWATTTGLRLVMRRRPVVFFEAAPVQHPLLGKWVCHSSSFAGGGRGQQHATHELSGSV